MTVTVSKLKNGTLTLGAAAPAGVDMSCQITNARINSAYSDDGDTLTTLCGDEVPPARKLDGRKLAGTIVQDFDLAAADGGVIDYLWVHELEELPFSFTPNLVGAPVITGTVTIEVPAETYGGDVGGQLTSDFEWSATIAARTYGAGVETAAAEGETVDA